MTIRSCVIRTSLIAFFVSPCAASLAATLQVAPVLVEVPAPGATASLSLKNEGDKPIDAQIRVFRWSQVDGMEKLVPADEVVASPPMVSIQPKANYSVRIVRLIKTPVTAEESYRLAIDELPAGKGDRAATVNLVLRYSIPVFFTAAGAAPAKVTWSLQKRDGKTFLTAKNEGDRRIRLSKLKLQDTSGGTASFGEGLAGYVLGHSTISWVVPNSSRNFGAGGLSSISALADSGPINVKP
jgi:fimbrial chaperone protein